MTQKTNSELNEENIPRPGSTLYNFHFKSDKIQKKKLRKWQKLNKYLVIPLYRVKILPLLGFGRVILLLETKGWKTGKIRRTPLEFRKLDGCITIFSAFGEKSAWVKNIRINPEEVSVRLGFHHFKPEVEFIDDTNQKISIMKQYVSEYSKSAKILFGWNPEKDNLDSIDFSGLVDLLSIIKLHKNN
ncbi:MAG: nitroreductase family deazaflavin-dependent oxidoreductase [Candidatus Lokiarchaeota archaeon]